MQIEKSPPQNKISRCQGWGTGAFSGRETTLFDAVIMAAGHYTFVQTCGVRTTRMNPNVGVDSG